MNKINLDKNTVIYLVSFFVLFIIFGISIYFYEGVDDKLDTKILEGEVISISSNLITIRDAGGNEYTVSSQINVLEGNNISLLYTGLLDLDKDTQDIIVVDCTIEASDTGDIPAEYKDNGIFSDYYELAYNKLKELKEKE